MSHVFLSYEAPDAAIGRAMGRHLRRRGMECLEAGHIRALKRSWRDILGETLPSCQAVLVLGSWGTVQSSPRQRYLIGYAAGLGLSLNWMLPIEDRNHPELASNDLIACSFIDFGRLLDVNPDAIGVGDNDLLKLRLSPQEDATPGWARQQVAAFG